MFIIKKPSWKTKTLLLLSIFLIVLCGYFACGNGVHAQSKRAEEIPKRYTFVLDSSSYMVVDSILRLSLMNTGYELKAKDADGLRQGLGMVLSYFQREKIRQDTTAVAKPKK